MRIRAHKILFCAFVMLALAAAPLSAASSIYAHIGDIKGDSLEERHKDWTQVISFSFGATVAVSDSAGAGGGTTAKAGDVVLLKNFDVGTPKLLDTAARGTLIPQVVIEWIRSDGTRMMRITLTQVVISAVNYGNANEGVSFNWSRMDIEYFTQNKDGSIGGTVFGTWDKKICGACA